MTTTTTASSSTAGDFWITPENYQWANISTSNGYMSSYTIPVSAAQVEHGWDASRILTHLESLGVSYRHREKEVNEAKEEDKSFLSHINLV